MTQNRLRPIEFLAFDKSLKPEVTFRLRKDYGITTVYALWLALKSSSPETQRVREGILGIKPGKLESFRDYIKGYTPAGDQDNQPVSPVARVNGRNRISPVGSNDWKALEFVNFYDTNPELV